MQWLTNFSAVSHTYLTPHIQWQCMNATRIMHFYWYITRFPRVHMYKIKDHGSRIAAWLIPVYQETYITTRLHKKKAFEHALHLRKCAWWIISKTRCNGNTWEMEKKLACRTEEWTAHFYYSGSFRCSWVRRDWNLLLKSGLSLRFQVAG